MSQPRSRREFLALTPGALAIALGVGAATGSTGPAGSSASIGPGTTNKIAKFLSSNTIGNSALTDDGTNVTTTEDIIPSADSARILGAAALRWDRGYIRRIDAQGNSLALIGQNIQYTLGSSGLLPDLDNSRNIGTSTNRWGTLYFASGISTVADIMNITGQNKTWTLGNALTPPDDLGRNIGSSNARLLKLFSLNIDSGNLDLTLKTNQTVVPNSDNALDFGNAGQRWRNGYFSGNLKARSKNVLVLDGQSMTQSSHTVSSADTDIVTYSLGANVYTHVIVRITGYVSFVTLSTNQSVNLKVKDGTTQVGNTMVVDGALSASASIPFTIEVVFVETSAATIHITEGAAAADANTTVFINSIVVLGES